MRRFGKVRVLCRINGTIGNQANCDTVGSTHLSVPEVAPLLASLSCAFPRHRTRGSTPLFFASHSCDVFGKPFPPSHFCRCGRLLFFFGHNGEGMKSVLTKVKTEWTHAHMTPWSRDQTSIPVVSLHLMHWRCVAIRAMRSAQIQQGRGNSLAVAQAKMAPHLIRHACSTVFS